MMASGSPLSIEVSLFEVVDYLDTCSIALCSTSSAMAALDASGVSSMTLVLVRSMMTPCTMVLSTTLDASSWTKVASSCVAATTTSSSSTFLFS